jgi:hypothetical protein
MLLKGLYFYCPPVTQVMNQRKKIAYVVELKKGYLEGKRPDGGNI